MLGCAEVGVCMCVHSNTIPCFDRKEIQELGMTLVINARKKAPPPNLYKALLMAQVKQLYIQQHLQTYMESCTTIIILDSLA